MIDSKPEFLITRSFDTQRERVWKAWTDPNQFGKWFGPRGFTAQSKTFDLRPGGINHSCLKSAAGPEMWAKFVYREVTPPSKLVWEHSFSDKDGNITRHPMSPTWPLKMLTTVTFEEEGNKTIIILTWNPIDATAIETTTFMAGMAGMNMGWTGTFDQLDEFLKTG
ncbi:MAG: SRPBCC domain-containing protein [Alphaproteobacteria bacterium]|nr:SRPBCC domain-containing protein [Alphaproteobacteria bacterium]